MGTQSLIVSKTIKNAAILHKQRDTHLFICFFLSALCLTLLLAWGAVAIVLGCLATLVVACLVIRWPVAGFFVVVVCAVLIEEEALWTPILTDQLTIFHWPPGLEGLVERPIGFLLLFICFVVVCKRFVKRQALLHGGPLLQPFLLYLLCIAVGVVHGLTSGGDVKITVVEIRPIWYLFASYMLAYNLLTRVSQVRALFWIVILCCGIKAVQGLYIYLVVLQGNLGSHREIMAHEESFFFASHFLLLFLFCVHHRYRPQMYIALLLFPVVLIAFIANQRRTDYVAIIAPLLASLCAFACSM